MFSTIRRFLTRPPTMNDCLTEHLIREQIRVDNGQIKARTLLTRQPLYRAIREHIGKKPLDKVLAGDVADLVLSIKQTGKLQKAASVRHMITRLYFEALETGMLPSGYNPGRLTPPTWHEQRSLAERLYREQGIDTRKLLGHRRQMMTDLYNNDRNLREPMIVTTKRTNTCNKTLTYSPK